MEPAQPPFVASKDSPAHGHVGLRPRLMRTREVVEFAIHTARKTQLPQVAAGLTFTSVLALVPLLAVVLAVLTAFPVFTEFRESIERELPKVLLPEPYGHAILGYLGDFAAKAAGVGAAGLAFLALPAFSMILTVDRILNDIWLVHRRRPIVQRLLVYWAVLSFGPLLLGLSLSLTSYVVSVSDARVDRWGPAAWRLIQLASPLIATAAYTVVYALVPNRKVAWRYALTGGVVTAITGELMSRAFAAYVIHGGVLTIYGAFAAIPIFLIWIYLSWLTFLFGAAIAATLPQLRTTRFFDTRRAGDRAITAMALLKLLLEVQGKGPLRGLGTGALARTLRTDEEELASLLAELQNLGYVRKLATDVDSDSDEWVLSCDPQTQGLAPLFHRFALDPENSLLHRPDLSLEAWLAPAIRGQWLQRGLAQLEGARSAPTGAAANATPRSGPPSTVG